VTDRAPAAIGPYSQAVRVGDMLFVSGQIPIDMDTGQILEGDITEQTRLVFRHLTNILDEAGFTLQDVVKSEVFLQDLDDFQAMNAVYASFFPDYAPARSTVEVGRVPKDVLLEIAVIASKEQNK
ncbi:MAG: RidA family protein, partial [Gammaproteobacteria bacterium]|nr:RidA family protein [Gammaproteobacteria bacterium]